MKKDMASLAKKDVLRYEGEYHYVVPKDKYKFIQNGYTTVPVIPKEDLANVQRRFLKVLRGFPEYAQSKDDPVYVLGGFAALGNPASFHNGLVRSLRKKAYAAVRPLFAELYPEFNMEMLVDRMMYRLKGAKSTAETWHRDVMPGKMIEDDDELFGGWINLDSDDQYFSCVPGSHLGIRQKTLASGFATVPKEFIKKVSEHKVKVRIPPGHMIIFPQYILHEVVATPAKHDMMRLFTGWRITKSTKPLYPTSELDKQAVIPLPGGMIPPMYAANHSSFYLHRPFNVAPGGPKLTLIEWSSSTFLPELLVDHGDYRLVKRHMDSLEEYGLPMYKAYSDEERALYTPLPLFEKTE